MDIIIKHEVLSGEQKCTKLIYDKADLNECEYFRGLFDTTDCGGDVVIDLTFVKYLEEKDIRLVFELQFGDYTKLDHLLYKQESAPSLSIIMEMDECERKGDYELKENMGLADLDIDRMYILGTMIDYLDFDKAKGILIECLNNYRSLFDRSWFRYHLKTIIRYYEKKGIIEGNHSNESNSDSSESNSDIDNYEIQESAKERGENYSLFLHKIVATLTESCTVYLPIGSAIDSNFYKKLKDSYYQEFIRSFIKRSYSISLAFSSLGMGKQYNRLLKIAGSCIKKTYSEYTSFFHHAYKLQSPFNEMHLRSYNFAEMYKFIKSNSDLMAFSNEENVNIYNYYDLMEYVNGGELFNCINIAGFNNSLVGRTIITYDEAIIKFKDKTNGMFNEIDWTNVKMKGTFMFKLLNDLPIENSMLHIVCRTHTSYQYIKHYLSSLDAYRYYSKGRCYYLVKDLLFDISIECYEPVRNDFDWTCIYYDGINFKTTIQGLILLKYSIWLGPTYSDLYDMIISGIIFDKDCSNSDIDDSEIYYFMQDGVIDFEEIRNCGYERDFGGCCLVRDIWRQGITDSSLSAIIKIAYNLIDVHKSVPYNIYCVKEVIDLGFITYFGGVIQEVKLKVYSPRYVNEGDNIQVHIENGNLLDALKRISLGNILLVKVNDINLLEKLREQENVDKLVICCKIVDGNAVMHLESIDLID